MAQPSTLTNQVREDVTTLIDSLYTVESILAMVEDTASGDPDRQIFFEAYLKDAQGIATTDITSTEFFTAIVVLRGLRTWLMTNRPVLAKLRV